MAKFTWDHVHIRTPDPEATAVQAGTRRKLDAAIAQLPEEFREVLILREMEAALKLQGFRPKGDGVRAAEEALGAAK